MTARWLNGEQLAQKILAELAPRFAELEKKRRRRASLVVLQSADGAAQSYRRSQEKACSKAGVDLKFVAWPSGKKQALEKLDQLAQDDSIDGLLADHPFPAGLDAVELAAHLPAAKDAEAVSLEREGSLYLAKSWKEIEARSIIAPPTALAVVALVREAGLPIEGKRAVVLGRSSIVGRPAAHLLSCLDATVVLCHSKTPDAAKEASRGDIVVACVGKARFVHGDWIQPGAVVIDAGINSSQGKLCGDVDFDACQPHAGFITPVPGGVGPVTTAMLLRNLLTLAEAHG
jgi:methylenetetrahydrofolate dehydrogenase (NADP+) / methenyltetrahydrofolate cyclohydrolase